MYTCIDWCPSIEHVCGWAIIITMAGAVVPIDFTPCHSSPHEFDVAAI